MKWIKASEDKFPTEFGRYFLRQPMALAEGWFKFIETFQPNATNKKVWKDQGWEWLDESPIQEGDIEKIPLQSKQDSEDELWKDLALTVEDNIDKTWGQIVDILKQHYTITKKQ